MDKRYRIKNNSEIDAIFKLKKVKGDSFFAIYQSDDPQGTNMRFAISIGKKYGNAVMRNLAKRRIRMIVSDMENQFIKNKLFIIVVKPSVRELSYQEMKAKLTLLIQKSKLTENING